MPELEEVPENALLRPTEGRHLGAGRRAAQHRHERDDEQLAKVMPSVPGAGIRDVFEGGEEQVHAGDGPRVMAPPPRIHPAVSRKGPFSARQSHMRFPCIRGRNWEQSTGRWIGS